jgi:LysM repeat protein
MPPRSPFRLLAPGALVAVLVAVWLLASPGPDRAADRPVVTATTTTAREPRRRSYTVRAGDSLSAVAARYGITVERLTELNPKVDPQTLRRGQRLRLRD